MMDIILKIAEFFCFFYITFFYFNMNKKLNLLQSLLDHKQFIDTFIKQGVKFTHYEIKETQSNGETDVGPLCKIQKVPLKRYIESNKIHFTNKKILSKISKKRKFNSQKELILFIMKNIKNPVHIDTFTNIIFYLYQNGLVQYNYKSTKNIKYETNDPKLKKKVLNSIDWLQRYKIITRVGKNLWIYNNII